MGEEQDKMEEWVADNLSEQRDEICALQSIFDDAGILEVLSVPCGSGKDTDSHLGACAAVSSDEQSLYAVKLTIPLPLESDEIKLNVWVQNDHDANGVALQHTANVPKPCKPEFSRSLSGQHWHCAVKVRHLPPLTLHATLPHSYPTSNPPIFTLSSLCLNACQLSLLCKQLDILWSESHGMPVLFTWADWLQNEAMRFLGIENELNLKAEDEDQLVNRDPRALPEFVDLQRDVQCILRHDFEVERKFFLQSMHTCDICFDEKLGQEFFRLNECSHHFCRECLTAYCQMHVKEGSVTQLMCPHDDCSASLPVPILEDVLGEEEYERWERLQLDRALESMSDIEWCPRCSFPVIRESDDSLNLAHCTQCIYSFCTTCKDSWHQGLPCIDDVEKLEALQEKVKDQRKTNRDAKKIRKIKETLLTKSFLKKISKPCPHCGVAIEKIGGCNKVTCSKCLKFMCYVCGKAISGYDHFQDSKCILFYVEGEDNYMFIAARRQLQQPVPEGAQRVQEALDLNPEVHNMLAQCPRCRQRNLKAGRNNHIRCWSCNKNFCFLCKGSFSKLAEHFSATGCPQHSD